MQQQRQQTAQAELSIYYVTKPSVPQRVAQRKSQAYCIHQSIGQLLQTTYTLQQLKYSLGQITNAGVLWDNVYSIVTCKNLMFFGTKLQLLLLLGFCFYQKKNLLFLLCLLLLLLYPLSHFMQNCFEPKVLGQSFRKKYGCVAY